ncbi:dolichol kinase sec59 [Podospora fimiseda]|uniref:dolichol kinase n=1 Tax=Podospora fimiseda TaxID=252190 RepID=A0AAN7BW70_9PEZI|nr:dolichol kinase sec59 [Podospora fimiseda]
MPEYLEQDPAGLRTLSRSPHPYHRQNSELHEPSDRLIYRTNRRIEANDNGDSEPFPSLINSTTASDSGTEADDEHFLKGLPAPKARLHKGLRGKDEPLSGCSTPLLSPAVLEEEGRKRPPRVKNGEKRAISDRIRRRKELVRRATEILLLGCEGVLIATSHNVRPTVRIYYQEFIVVGGLLVILASAYPLRVVLWAYRRGKPSELVPLRIPPAFDPAPLLYPLLIPVFVSLLVAENVEAVVIPNLVLGIAALPRALFPGSRYWEVFSLSHWFLSCVPFTFGRFIALSQKDLGGGEISPEILVLLYPLHQTLCLILQYLTTTSLLVAELQLLSVALVNLLLLSTSPQAIILQAVLWGGGLGLIIFCSRVIRWGISLARVPKWRFQRSQASTKGVSYFRILRQCVSLALGKPRHDLRADFGGDVPSDSGHSTDGYLDVILKKTVKADTIITDGEISPVALETPRPPRLSIEEPIFETPPRRHTLPSVGGPVSRSKTNTPSGRRKRSASSSVRAFFSLTKSQATQRKWIYAGYVYFCSVAVIFAGIRSYVQKYALSGEEPIGWSLGYLFGDLPQFRFQVVNANLERWICLPLRGDGGSTVQSCSFGWVDHVRRSFFGEANSRLILSAYWVVIIVFGLAVVFRLSPIYEVDTRRKVFHFMMVAMFLPTIYVDPTWIALALSIMLAVFLLLDLLRASQLPPLSKPIAAFLTPYVDGRDLRGPVVISHIFLLIGCAIPLWLSLASLGRTGEGYLRGWEVPAREVSMVSGVVCVGLGDAAASLIGRRLGHRKWLWGGGKSIEGSVAFAAAVFVGLMTASAWLRVGGWLTPTSGPGAQSSASGYQSLLSVLDPVRIWGWAFPDSRKALLCASVASLTEAVLTGGNDNVVVPVVLWTCVKSMGM